MDGDSLDTFQHRFRGRVRDRDFLVVAAVENGVDHRLHQQRVFNGMPGAERKPQRRRSVLRVRIELRGQVLTRVVQGDREVANKLP